MTLGRSPRPSAWANVTSQASGATPRPHTAPRRNLPAGQRERGRARPVDERRLGVVTGDVVERRGAEQVVLRLEHGRVHRQVGGRGFDQRL